MTWKNNRNDTALCSDENPLCICYIQRSQTTTDTLKNDLPQ